MNVMHFLRFLVACWACLIVTALPAQTPESNDSARGELIIEGQSIKSLTLVRQGDESVSPREFGMLQGQRFDRPAGSLWLKPGKYRVENVEVEGGLASHELFGRPEDWFEVAPGEPHRLAVGAPLTPHVNVNRHGRFLQMDYQLVDGDGRSYRRSFDPEYSQGPGLPPPRFTVRKNGELLGSEDFRYG